MVWLHNYIQSYKTRCVDWIEVNKYDLTKLRALSFVYLDVICIDPPKKALRELDDVLAPSGVMVVHDCNPGFAWNGAYQVHIQFMEELNQPGEIVFSLGIIKKVY